MISAISRLQPYSLRMLLAVSLGAATLAFAMNIEFFTSSFAASDMRDLVRSLKTQLPYWSLPLGWLAVWIMRVHAPDSVLVGPAPGRPRAAIVVRQLGALSAATLLGALLGTAPVVVVMLTTQYWTAPDLVSFAAVLVALASLLPVAACAAALTGQRLGLLVAPLLVVLVTLLPAFVINDQLLANRPVSIMSTAYVWSVGLPARGEMLAWQVELLRILYFGLVWIVAVKITTGLADWRAAAQPRGLVSLSWLALPLAVTAVVGYQQPILVEEDPGDQVRCEAHDRLNICVYQIDDPHRGFIAEAFAPLIRLTQTDEAVPFTITQDLAGAAVTGPGPDDVLTVGRMRRDAAEWLDVELTSAAAMLSGLGVDCRDERSSALAEVLTHQLLLRAAQSSPTAELRSAYSGRLDETGVWNEEAATQLATLSDQEFAEWFGLRRGPIAACALTTADLP
ncbi:MAG: hypothetical protein GX596_05610 [Propionibacterium sp.]|nr:hypothetical protein [Propionibacterium sp.]